MNSQVVKEQRENKAGVETEEICANCDDLCVKRLKFMPKWWKKYPRNKNFNHEENGIVRSWTDVE